MVVPIIFVILGIGGVGFEMSYFGFRTAGYGSCAARRKCGSLGTLIGPVDRTGCTPRGKRGRNWLPSNPRIIR